ncbi:MAG: cytochrome b/b6 domain-containing protein [Nocardia sp.]|nr:cytochrome b/b6 domain-containing protein [Nocardia sp.]
MAVLVVAMLFLGAALVGSISDYHRVLRLHESVGVLVLVLAVLRIANRLRRTTPAQIPSIGRLERAVATTSEILMYALLVAQPLVGWGLVSASGVPVRVLGGLRLPPIAPADVDLYDVLRDLHTVLAYGLLAALTMHMCAVLAHALLLRDGLLDRMLFTLGGRRFRVVEGTRRLIRRIADRQR